jgi:hypothetical protein
VRAGKIHVAAVIPRNFGAGAIRALFSERARPQEAFSGASGQAALADSIARLDSASPEDVPERAELKNLLEALRNLNARVGSEGGGSALGLQRGLSIPYVVATRAVNSARSVPYNGYAHSFCSWRESGASGSAFARRRSARRSISWPESSRPR